MTERLRQAPGFAIIGRFHYSGEGDKQRLQSVAQFDLTPGQGLLFVESQGTPAAPIPFTKETMAEALQSILPEKRLQLLAFMTNSGDLLFTSGKREESYGLSQDFPLHQRIMSLEIGNTTFSGILGKSKQEAYSMLRVLQEARRRLN